MKFDDWTDDKVAETLGKFFDDTVAKAQQLIGWYSHRGSQMGKRSRRVRFLAIVSGTAGALLPVLGIVVGSPTDAASAAIMDFDVDNLGYVFLALAAALVTADNAFGWSSSWMRFRTTEMELERLFSNFRFDWAIELARLNGQQPGPEDRQALLRLQCSFVDAFQAAAEAETASWVQEFRASLSELARTYKATATERAPGAIDVSVTNAAKAEDELEVRVDRRPAGTLVGGNYQITEVPPGPHAVEVIGKINGKLTGASGAVVVQPGAVAQVELTLLE